MDDIVVVAGIPRSGTTLAMHMLYAGGLSVYADNLYSFETALAPRLPYESAFLHDCHGKAVKILDPWRHRLPPGLPYRTILMSRDVREQVRSQIKFLQTIGMRVPNTSKVRYEVRQSIQRDMHQTRKYLATLGPVLPLAFEDILTNPHRMAEALQDFVGVSLDCEAMAAVVIPRDPACYPGMLERQLAEAAGVAHG